MASSGGEGRLKVVRALNPFSPVALFTPQTEQPLAAVAATDILAGEPIAPYLVDVDKPSTVDPFSRVAGHVVAARITAENAADGWKPTVGAIQEIDFQSLPGVWGYFSVGALIFFIVTWLFAVPLQFWNAIAVWQAANESAKAPDATLNKPAA